MQLAGELNPYLEYRQTNQLRRDSIGLGTRPWISSQGLVLMGHEVTLKARDKHEPITMSAREAIDSVSQEEFDRNVWSDRKGEGRFKYAERHVLITPEMTTSPEAKGTSPFMARVLIVWSQSKARLDLEWRETYMKHDEERLRDIGETKLNKRRYKDKDYAQSQVERILLLIPQVSDNRVDSIPAHDPIYRHIEPFGPCIRIKPILHRNLRLFIKLLAHLLADALRENLRLLCGHVYPCKSAHKLRCWLKRQLRTAVAEIVDDSVAKTTP